MERHPSELGDLAQQVENIEAYALWAWKETDTFAEVGRYTDEFMLLLQDDTAWMADLLGALRRFHESRSSRMRKPQTTRDKVERWIRDSYLSETSRVAPAKPPETQAAVAVGALGKNVKTAAGAVKKLFHDERAKRKQIMRQWAPAWIAYYKRMGVPMTAEWFERLVTQGGAQ